MVKRYEEIVVSHVIGAPVLTRVVERSGGKYVLHSDYSAIESRIAELEKDAARWRYVADQHSVAWADEIDDAMSREA